MKALQSVGCAGREAGTLGGEVTFGWSDVENKEQKKLCM